MQWQSIPLGIGRVEQRAIRGMDGERWLYNIAWITRGHLPQPERDVYECWRRGERTWFAVSRTAAEAKRRCEEDFSRSNGRRRA